MFHPKFINCQSGDVFYLYSIGLLKTCFYNCSTYNLQYWPFDLFAYAMTLSSLTTSVFMHLIMSLTICDNLYFMENVGGLRKFLAKSFQKI